MAHNLNREGDAMSKSTIARIGPPQTPTEDYPRFPSHYLGLEWTQTENVKQLAYGLRINSTLAMLAFKGLRAHEVEAGIPLDDVYALVDTLISGVDLAAFVLAQKLDALPKDEA